MVAFPASIVLGVGVLIGAHALLDARLRWFHELTIIATMLGFALLVAQIFQLALWEIAAVTFSCSLATACARFVYHLTIRRATVSIGQLAWLTSLVAIAASLVTMSGVGEQHIQGLVIVTASLVAAYYLQKYMIYHGVNRFIALGCIVPVVYVAYDWLWARSIQNFGTFQVGIGYLLSNRYAFDQLLGSVVFSWIVCLIDPVIQPGRARNRLLQLPMLQRFQTPYNIVASEKALWDLDARTIYLNHGSFGPPPYSVVNAQKKWRQRMNAQPMDFFVRQLEPAWFAARDRLSAFVGCRPDDLIFCENATAGMNHLASFFPLQAGDEVLLTDHEYGVVKRIWKHRCDRVGARVREVQLPLPMSTREEVVEAIEHAFSPHTKLLVVSHITSPTAIQLPVYEICERARRRGIATCIDGPHAPLQTVVDIQRLGCDFYTASCHKWLCAPFGTGFMYVDPKWQEQAAQPLMISWGRLLPSPITKWSDHYIWCGTRDYSGYLSIPAAIEFFEHLGIDDVRARNHRLAQYARQRLIEDLQAQPLTPDDESWYGSMVAVELPAGDYATLQVDLWKKYRIEIPIVRFGDRTLVRVSCHMYNDAHQIDQLVLALEELIHNPGRDG